MRRPDHRHGHEAALTEHDVRLDPPKRPLRLPVALQHTDRVRKILKIEVTTKLPRGDPRVRHLLALHHLLLDAVVGTDVVHLIAVRPKTRHQCDICSDMTSGTTTGQHDLFRHHRINFSHLCCGPSIGPGAVKHPRPPRGTATCYQRSLFSAACSFSQVSASSAASVVPGFQSTISSSVP